jgi:hypothetical protein
MPTGARQSADLRGFGIPDTRFSFANLSSTYSSYTQAGPRPGSPIPSDANSKLLLSVSGEQSDNLTATVTRAGQPAIDQGGVRVAVRKTSASAVGGNFGWNAPNLINGFVAAEYSSANTCSPPDAAVIPSTSAVVAVYQRGNAINSNLWDADAWTWGGRQTVVDLGGSGGMAAVLCIPGGTERLLCIAVGTDYTQGVVYYSDNGTSWALWNQNVLPSAPTTTTRLRARAFHHDRDVGFWLVVDAAGTTTVYHYGSTNLGTSFSLVSTWSVGASAAAPDFVKLADGRFGAVYINGSSLLTFRRAATIWDAFSSDTTTIDGTNTYSECAAYVDHDGAIYVFARSSVTADHWTAYRSTDGGDSFTQFKWGLYDGNDLATYPSKAKAVACAGYAAVVHQWVASPGDEDNSIAMMVGGGWSSFEAAPVLIASTTDEDARRMGTGPTSVSGCNSVTWLPYDAPSDVAGWTTSGAGTDVLSANGTATVTTAGGQTRAFAATSSSTSSRSLMAMADVDVTSGGHPGTPIIGARATTSTGATGYQVDVNLTSTTVSVTDESANELGTATVDTTTPVQIKVTLAANSSGGGSWADVAYRRRGETVWTLIYSGAVPSMAAAPSAGSTFTWGHVVAGDGVSDWSLAWVAFGGTASATTPYWTHPGSGDTWHDDLIGKALNAYAYPLGLQASAGTTYIRALAGPGRVAETHSIPVVYDYGIERLFWEISPSPDEVWRSTSTAEQIIAWDFGIDTQVGKSIAVFLGNANFRTAYFERWDGAAWQTLATYDASTGFTGLTAAVSGNVIRPNTSTTAAAGRYIQRGEFVGDTIVSSGVYHEIAWHSEGVWAPSSTSTSKAAEFRVASGTPAAGTASIIAGTAVLVIHNITTYDDRFRLRIPSQSTKDNYFECGLALVCQLQPVGRQWEWGSSRDRELNVSESKSRRGTARRTQLGPPPERWTIAWTEPVDLAPLRLSSDVDWLSAKAGYAPLANRDDVPWLLLGLLEELAAGETPILLINSIPDASSADYATLTDSTRFCYGYIDSSISATIDLGDEGEDELERIDPISIARVL